MFELPSLEQVIKTVLITALAYYAYHISKEQEEESQKRAKEQKELQCIFTMLMDRLKQFHWGTC